MKPAVRKFDGTGDAPAPLTPVSVCDECGKPEADAVHDESRWTRSDGDGHPFWFEVRLQDEPRKKLPPMRMTVRTTPETERGFATVKFEIEKRKPGRPKGSRNTKTEPPKKTRSEVVREVLAKHGVQPETIDHLAKVEAARRAAFPQRSIEAEITSAVVKALRGIDVVPHQRIRIAKLAVRPEYAPDDDADVLSATIEVKLSLVFPRSAA